MQEQSYKGRFISFEGGEGAGKSTQCKLLINALNQANIKSVKTREPGGTKGAESIRGLLVTGNVDKWNPKTELLLHVAARNDHVEKLIKPALIEGKFVICDRFVDSTIAYQGYGHQLDKNLISQLHELILEDFQPDLTIILDMKPEDGIQRAAQRGDQENRYEKMGENFHARVRNGFLEIAKSEPRCIIINAKSSINEVHSQIIDAVNNKFNLFLNKNEAVA